MLDNRTFITIRKHVAQSKLRFGIPGDIRVVIQSKVDTIRNYAEQSGIQYFIETGTYLGGTTEAAHDLFTHTHTIELDPYLYTLSKVYLQKYPNITCHQGDSAEILTSLLPTIKGPILYWLDAHYSRGITEKGDDYTPVVRELIGILNHPYRKESIILIDDARCFIGKEDYPPLPFLETWIKERWKQSVFVVTDDIIRIYQKELL